MMAMMATITATAMDKKESHIHGASRAGMHAAGKAPRTHRILATLSCNAKEFHWYESLNVSEDTNYSAGCLEDTNYSADGIT